MEEQALGVFERAFEAIDRLKNLRLESWGDTVKPESMQTWKAIQSEPEPPLRKKCNMTPQEPDWPAWNEWAGAKTRAVVQANDAVRMEALRQEFVELRKLMNAGLTDEVARLNRELSDLREAMAELRRMIAAARNIPLDLPSPLRAA
jgi:hypothetical protein